jgi:ribosomal protein S18 acetylase RimI-like enzyme
MRTYRHPDDYAAVRSLWESIERGIHLGRSDTADEIAKKVADHPDLFVVAEAGTQLIGAIMGGFDGRRGLLYHLGVSEAHRRKGIGSALLREIENRLRARGCLKCYLLVTKDNSEGIEYYLKRGWSPMQEVDLLGKEL